MAEDNRDADRTFLILTSHGGLVSQAGEEGAEAVYASLEALAAARRSRGHTVHIYVPDNAEVSSVDAGAVEGALTPEKVRDGLARLESKICPSSHLDYVLIAGDGGVIPFWYLENPAADSDGTFPTDVPYGVAGEGAAEDLLLPDRMVARIPLGAGADGGLAAYLKAMASREWRGAAAEVTFGLSALQWKRESTKVYGVVAAGDLRTSPPVDTSAFRPEWLPKEGIVYFNVHGSKDEKYWYGQDGLSYPRALSPEIVARSDAYGAVVLSEACYGGLVEDRTPADSVAMSFLVRGVSAFVGSGAIAYGSPDVNLTEADLLAYLFFKRLVRGETAGEAFREARIDFAAEMLERQGFLDGDDRKTLLEFNLFGDPSVGIYKGRGLEDRSVDMVSEEVLASIKKIASQRFPEMEGVEPEVSVQAGAADEAVAKKIGALRPASTVKAVQRPPGKVFVASFRQNITVEGREIERVVRITFRESGQVIKVITSK